MHHYSLALIGFGGVNRALAEIVADQSDELTQSLGYTRTRPSTPCTPASSRKTSLALCVWRSASRRGGVVLNDSSDYRFDAMPFGGATYGSMGREGVRFAYEEMTQPKVVCINDGFSSTV